MKLTDDQYDVICHEIDMKWPEEKRACAICGERKWYINDAAIYVPVDAIFPLPPNSPVMAFVVVSCSRCGNTILFNAVEVGIVPGVNDAIHPSSETKHRFLQ